MLHIKNMSSYNFKDVKSIDVYFIVRIVIASLLLFYRYCYSIVIVILSLLLFYRYCYCIVIVIADMIITFSLVYIFLYITAKDIILVTAIKHAVI